MTLDEIHAESRDSPTHFEHKRILWIGSESYDAPAVCVLEGLDALGFEVYTIGKPNVNSWFCNQAIDDPNRYRYSFVLSSLHWGTRWSHYDKYGLHGYPKVLIDGDDCFSQEHTWRDKHALWAERYGYEGDEAVKDAERQMRRWMEPLGGYKPDAVFTMQKHDKDTYYLPSGIHRRYLAMNEALPLVSRHIHFAHFPTSGVWRDAMRDLLRIGALPGTIHNLATYGAPIYPDGVEPEAENVHSLQRLACCVSYYHILNRSKVLIHPGIDHWPFWECQRIYEGWACGCVVAMSVPRTNVSDYPPTEVCPEAVYSSHEELIRIAREFHDRPEYLEVLRAKSLRRSRRFFTPKPVARYFLHKIRESL